MIGNRYERDPKWAQVRIWQPRLRGKGQTLEGDLEETSLTTKSRWGIEPVFRELRDGLTSGRSNTRQLLYPSTTKMSAADSSSSSVSQRSFHLATVVTIAVPMTTALPPRESSGARQVAEYEQDEADYRRDR